MKLKNTAVMKEKKDYVEICGGLVFTDEDQEREEAKVAEKAK